MDTFAFRRSQAALPALAVALTAAFAASPAAANLTIEEGDARDPDSGRLLYREEHLIRREGERPMERLVLYRCPNGVAFARKRVDYRPSRLAPDFELIDVRGYREGLRRDAGGKVAWSGDRAPRRIGGGTDAPLVADAGFDEFLRAQWPRLLAGEAQPMAFVVPAFGRSLPFKVRSLGPAADPGMQRFELKLDGMLGMLGGSRIAVYYNAQDRRLRRFNGITNVRDAAGKQLRARIDFPSAPRSVEPARWQAAASLRLAPCRVGG